MNDVSNGDAPEIEVGILDGPGAEDKAVAAEIADLINQVFNDAESGIWSDGATRTTADEVARLAASGEIAVARREGDLVGTVWIHEMSGHASEFGLLVSDPQARGLGIGSALLDFAEDRARRQGSNSMRLELLVPCEWSHPSKQFLKGWYGRRGYRIVDVTTVEHAHPHLAPNLITRCDLEVHEKPLG